MDPEQQPQRANEPRPSARSHAAKRARKGWKGRRTPLRPCGAPGDEVWQEQGAGE